MEDNRKPTPLPIGFVYQNQTPTSTNDSNGNRDHLKGGAIALSLLVGGFLAYNPVVNFCKPHIVSAKASIERSIKNHEQKIKRENSDEIVKVRDGVFDYKGKILFTVENDIVGKQGGKYWTLDGLLNKHHKCAPENIPRTPLTDVFYKINNLDRKKPLQAYQPVKIPVAILTPSYK